MSSQQEYAGIERTVSTPFGKAVVLKLTTPEKTRWGKNPDGSWKREETIDSVSLTARQVKGKLENNGLHPVDKDTLYAAHRRLKPSAKPA